MKIFFKILSSKVHLVVIFSMILSIFSASPLYAETTLSDSNVKTDYLGLPPGPGPVEVQTTFHLHNINNIDDQDENFEFTGVLILSWKDPRQAFDPKVEMLNEKIYQGEFQFNELSPAWYPQVILKNESGLFEKHGTILRIKPDGTSTLIETINAVAEVNLDMTRHPFDSQVLEAIFEVVGFNSNEVLLTIGSENGVTYSDDLSVSQWNLGKIRAEKSVSSPPYLGGVGSASNFILKIQLHRESLFMMRLIIVPLAVMVLLSWCVFWKDRSSLGDRINISFIGILTAVAYQTVISDQLPHISYLTLTNAFVNISLFTMCSTVIINLIVGGYDKRGMVEAGNRIDKRCRKIYPIVYFGLLIIFTLIVFIFY